MPDVQQTQKTSQNLTLSPRLRQALEVLQAPALELRTTILSELQNNPVLEELPLNPELTEIPLDDTSSESSQTESDSDPQKAELDFKDNLDRLLKLGADTKDDFDQEATSYTPDDALRRQHFFDSLVAETSLQEHLLQQAQQSDASNEEVEALRCLIGSLDDRGFLTIDLSDTEALKVLSDQVSPTTFKKAAQLLKTFDPPGIGTADLQECLLTQLQLQGKGDSLAAEIVTHHYERLLHHRIPELQKQLKATPKALQAALNTIAALDTAPGRKFSEDHNRTILPDVTVQKDGDQWRILINNDYIPKLRISSIYKALLAKKTLSSKEKDYIREKIRSGKFLINAITQRQETLERITRELLRLQKGFFEKGPTQLQPLIMNQVAAELEVHETTISRAISNKYLKTTWGILPFKYFFTAGYTDHKGKGVSRTSVKEVIARIIQNEDARRPLSDQAITDELAKRQLTIARRTVAKYREELGIPPVHLRRKYDLA